MTVRRLLASIWRRSPRDWRDYTVLHLMAYYGLRPSEVAALRLDAVDWEAATLRVDQRKTQSILILPARCSTGSRTMFTSSKCPATATG
jgi:integrase/recombinase XerD